MTSATWGHRAFFELCWACSHRPWVIYIHLLHFLLDLLGTGCLAGLEVCCSLLKLLLDPAAQAAQEVVAIVARLHRIASHRIAGRRSRLRHSSSVRSVSCVSLDSCSILSEFINALSKIIFTDFYIFQIFSQYCTILLYLIVSAPHKLYVFMSNWQANVAFCSCLCRQSWHNGAALNPWRRHGTCKESVHTS